MSLYPREGYYIPSELDIKVNLLVLSKEDHIRVGDITQIKKPTGVSWRDGFEEYDYMTLNWKGANKQKYKSDESCSNVPGNKCTHWKESHDEW